MYTCMYVLSAVKAGSMFFQSKKCAAWSFEIVSSKGLICVISIPKIDHKHWEVLCWTKKRVKVQGCNL